MHDWFSNLIDDSDALDSTQIDSDILEKVVAQTGAMIDSFVSDFAQDEYHEKTMIDIEVLQFPDNDHPYFKVTYLCHQHKPSTITYVYSSFMSSSKHSLIHQRARTVWLEVSLGTGRPFPR